MKLEITLRSTHGFKTLFTTTAEIQDDEPEKPSLDRTSSMFISGMTELRSDERPIVNAVKIPRPKPKRKRR